MHERLSFFIERPSLIHRLNPFTKLTLVFTLIIIAFLTPIFWLPCLLFFIIIIPLSVIGKVQTEFINAVARILLPAVGFIFIMQAIFYPTEGIQIFHIWVLDITVESVKFAFSTSTRILVMVSSFILLLLTTHPSELMSDLTQRGMPGTLSYVITSTLQIIPQMQVKANTIIDAQRSRGLETSGNLLKRTGALLPLVGPLVFGSIVDVEERAIAIEARAFTSSIKKTSLREINDPTIEKVIRWFFLFTMITTVGLRIWLS
jgi:energy-coupling factor transport system permease protein